MRYQKLLIIIIFFCGWILNCQEPNGTNQDLAMQKYLIGEGTIYETPYYVYKSFNEGPAILIEGGIHGDELAGTYAIDSLLTKIQILSGKLILFPRMNVPACKAQKRYINVDLNHVFPGKEGEEHYEYRLAKEIFDMVGQQKIEYIVTLHESRYLHTPDNPKTFGQTIVYGVKPIPEYLPAWLERLNSLNQDPKETFFLHYWPVENSSTETIVEAFGLKGGFCVETWRGFSMGRRIELQTNLITTFLNTVGFEYKLLSD